MHTRVISLQTDYDEGIALGAKLLSDGALVAFPTETVYGLGANALCGQAVRKIFWVKGRPSDNPLIVHVADRKAIAALVMDVPVPASQLMDAFWPGPLTIVLPKSPIVPAEVCAGLSTVALRMPANEAALDLLRAARIPVAAPSANASGRPSPTCAAHVLEDLGTRIPLVLDGGNTLFGVESTVIMLMDDGVQVLRPGGVTAEMLKEVAGKVRISPSVLKPPAQGEQAISPGVAHAHYAPRARVLVVEGEGIARAAFINNAYDSDTAAEKRIFCAEETRRFYDGRACVIMGARDDTAGMCTRLFALLREMDALGVQSIFIEGVDEAGMGLALMNRMLRAAGFHHARAT